MRGRRVAETHGHAIRKFRPGKLQAAVATRYDASEIFVENIRHLRERSGKAQRNRGYS